MNVGIQSPMCAIIEKFLYVRSEHSLTTSCSTTHRISSAENSSIRTSVILDIVAARHNDDVLKHRMTWQRLPACLQNTWRYILLTASVSNVSLTLQSVAVLQACLPCLSLKRLKPERRVSLRSGSGKGEKMLMGMIFVFKVEEVLY